jgi:DNA helicase-2/ATP-dependent DNA helicase PcrA
MYVAITRAENHIFLSRAVSRMRRWQTQYNPPSRFIAELPENLLTTYDLTGNTTPWGKSASTPLAKGDEIQHKIFGAGYIVELWGNSAIVHFDNSQYGIRKIDLKTLARL